MTAHIVVRLGGKLFQTRGPAAANVQLQKCCASDWQECSSIGRTRLSVTGVGDKPGNPGRCRTRAGGRESQSWTRCAVRQRSELTAGSASVRRWRRSTARCSSPGDGQQRLGPSFNGPFCSAILYIARPMLSCGGWLSVCHVRVLCRNG